MGTWKLKKNMRSSPVDYEKQGYAWLNLAWRVEQRINNTCTVELVQSDTGVFPTSCDI